MEAEELKRKLMGLWEKTTHNSKELLSELFGYYFDMDCVEYKESEGKVVSALCGIPYTFGYKPYQLKGLYLIPLSSEEGYQKKGVLGDLINRFNNKIKDEYDFTFLIPHSDLMADYYASQDYLSSFFILEERYTPLHDFKNDFKLSLYDSDERIRILKEALMQEIRVEQMKESDPEMQKSVIDFIRGVEEEKMSSVNLNHTEKDLEYFFSPNSIRKLNFFIAFDSDNITGVAVTQKEDIKRTKVLAFYTNDTVNYFALLDKIKRDCPDDSLSVITFDPKYQSHSIIQETYVSSNPAGGDLDNTFSVEVIPFNINKLLQPMGMVKLLNFEKIFSYLASTRSDIQLKLYIRDYKSVSNPENDKPNSLFILKNGQFTIEPYHHDKKDGNILILNKKEISELLLRKNDSSNIIMEAFGVPRLNLQMRLLPC